MIGGALSPSVTAVKLESEKQSPVLSILFTNSLSSSNYLNSVLFVLFCFSSAKSEKQNYLFCCVSYGLCRRMLLSFPSLFRSFPRKAAALCTFSFVITERCSRTLVFLLL